MKKILNIYLFHAISPFKNKWRFFLVAFTFSFTSYAQKANLFIGLSEKIDFISYSTTTLELGSRINFKNSNFDISVGNDFLGNIKRKEVYSLYFQSYQLSLNLHYYFRKDKILQPFVGTRIGTEITTNYRYRYLNDVYFPSSEPPHYYNKDHTQPIYSYSSFFYQKMPLNLSLNLGLSIKVWENLHFTFSMESAMRFMLVKHLNWTKENVQDKSLPTLLKDVPLEQRLNNYFGARVGLNYYFSFKKINHETKL